MSANSRNLMVLAFLFASASSSQSKVANAQVVGDDVPVSSLQCPKGYTPQPPSGRTPDSDDYRLQYVGETTSEPLTAGCLDQPTEVTYPDGSVRLFQQHTIFCSASSEQVSFAYKPDFQNLCSPGMERVTDTNAEDALKQICVTAEFSVPAYQLSRKGACPQDPLVYCQGANVAKFAAWAADMRKQWEAKEYPPLSVEALCCAPDEPDGTVSTPPTEAPQETVGAFDPHVLFSGGMSID